ncbi:MAG: cation:proton antiporter, partial [Actinomycetota bacterium]|nr:cation:proton antiporter [Actinomycetota bacterium]
MLDDLFAYALTAVIVLGLAAFMRQRGWGIALPLIALGVAVGLAPFGPAAPPEPEVILILLLAPLVFGEALSSSYLDLRRVSRPVLALAIGLVLTATLVVGGVVSLFVAMPLAVAFALGAIVSPTDAVAVSTIAKRASLPRRLVSILEGESLVNDGTGLTALRVAVVAAVAGSVTMLNAAGMLAAAVGIGVLVGALAGWGMSTVLRRSRDLVAANSLIVVAPFLIYVVAEEFEGSGILAVVVA